jgi:[protein-PII] uridylyltransferase
MAQLRDEHIADRRAIIDRRAVAERIAGVPADEIGGILCGALEYGRAEVAKRLAEKPGNGRSAAEATAYLHDQLVRLAHDATGRPTEGGLALVGLGGTGRGEMAPFSDLDLMFLTAKAPTAEEQRLAEAVLHLLWDLKLKVGHSVRSAGELMALAKKDMTVRTALLESRLLLGDDKVFDSAVRRFRKEIVAGSAAEFVAAKLAERDQRHPTHACHPHLQGAHP